MAKTRCINCGSLISLDKPREGSIITCSACGVELEVIRTDPFTVDFIEDCLCGVVAAVETADLGGVCNGGNFKRLQIIVFAVVYPVVSLVAVKIYFHPYFFSSHVPEACNVMPLSFFPVFHPGSGGTSFVIVTGNAEVQCSVRGLD